VNAKKKIEIKHAFPFPTDKAVDVLATVPPKTRKSLKSFMKTRNPRTPEVIDHELMRIWNTMLECMYIGAIQKESAGRLERASELLICIKI
jgi:L-serine dehydratase